MEPLQALILGIVQGLTEFLPVSSSGHLVLFQHLFGLREPLLAFDISVHVGTLAAVLIYFRKDIFEILAALGTFVLDASRRQHPVSAIQNDPRLRMAFLIFVGSVPTAILGLFFHSIAEELFGSVARVGVALCITALLLIVTRWSRPAVASMQQFGLLTALGIGFVQGLAIVPGISRSGATIATGLLLGLDRETAARFSFLLSIPAICGASLLAAKDLLAGGPVPFPIVLLGTAVSAVIGYAALWLLVYIVRRGRMHYFAPYCALLGVAALLLG